MSEETPAWSNTSVAIYGDLEQQLVIMQVPVKLDGHEETIIELCYPPEQARELAFTLTTTSMEIEEDRLP